jgi:hypothetical protein
MNRTVVRLAVVTMALFATSLVSAQTTQPGDAIDIEIVNPVNGTNAFCVAPNGTVEARVFVRPGTSVSSCTLSCSGPSVPGGSANIATAVIDLAFDGSKLTYVADSIEGNGSTAGIQGLAQEQNLVEDRIGWALAGSWSTPGDPSSSLLSPCDMQMVTTADWLFRMQFQAAAAGMTTVRLRREDDAQPFALSFADICGTEAFKQSNGGIDEIRNAVVMVSGDCNDLIFFDNFGTGGIERWAVTAGS